MAHLITDSKFPQSAPSPAPRISTESTYTATTILTVTMYSRKISDGVTAVTHGPLSKLSKNPVTAVSTANSVVVEGGSDIDPDDGKAEEMAKFLHYIGIHDEANTSTRETVDTKARCTSRGVRYIHKFHNFPDHPFWDWDGNRTPKKDECGRRIVRWGELSSERKFRLQREFIHRRVTHLGLLIMALVVVLGVCLIAWIWRRQWRRVTTRRWEEMKIVYHGHARPLFDNARATLKAWFTAKKEIIEYELRDWEERGAQYTEIGATDEHINDSQRTFIGDQDNSEAGFAAASVEGGNNDDKSSQELLDELASEEDWMEEPNTSNPMRRLGSVIRGVFRQTDNVEIPTEPQIYEAVTLFDVDEVEEEFNLHHLTSQDTLVNTEGDAGEGDRMIISSRAQYHEESTFFNDEEEAGEDDHLLMSSEPHIEGENITGEATAEYDFVPLIHIEEVEREDSLINLDETASEDGRRFLSPPSNCGNQESLASFVATEKDFESPRSSRQDDLDMDDEAASEGYFLLSSSIHSDDSQKTLVNSPETEEDFIFQRMSIQGDIINMDDEAVSEEDFLLRSSDNLIDINNEAAGEEDFLLRSSIHSIDSEETLVNNDETSEENDSLLRSLIHSADSDETLVDTDGTFEEDDYSSQRLDRQDDLIEMDDEAAGEEDFLLRSSIHSSDSEETLVNSDGISEEDDFSMRSSTHSIDSEETLVNSDGTTEEDDFSMRSSLTSIDSIDSQEILVGTYDGFQEYDPLLLTPMTSNDSEATLINTYESDGDSDRMSVLSGETLVNTNEDNREEDLLRAFILRTERERRLRNLGEWLHSGDSD
ncbi:hypothetical protein FPQ18DRAFT_383702 [Pyronema domesticum]|uniref:Uncharacterized protein n=1 Tax=Pyronema omphalodes (strain CBS 100304) TaxID=1076935 RepID=U4L7A6_PYROM|nr:hypothetical protein FPQ18DRAFT_383702 [Pyronema domesticum]CCX13525.1 Protein of unknown function [Pyronema omphalodes CBS 100304]